MSDDILAAATLIANEWRAVAAAWHIAAAILLVALWRNVDRQWVIGGLALMLFSVAALAWWSGNPFNGTMFVAVGIMTVVIAATSPPLHSDCPSYTDVCAGAVMCAFGWLYPHFLNAPAWQYLYSSPLGLIPCPTLAFIIGTSLLTNSFGSKLWPYLFGSVGLLYGLIGVFVLGVMIDWLLVAGAATLLLRAVAALQVDDVMLERKRRHV